MLLKTVPLHLFISIMLGVREEERIRTLTETKVNENMENMENMENFENLGNVEIRSSPNGESRAREVTFKP